MITGKHKQLASQGCVVIPYFYAVPGFPPPPLPPTILGIWLARSAKLHQSCWVEQAKHQSADPFIKYGDTKEYPYIIYINIYENGGSSFQFIVMLNFYFVFQSKWE